MRIKPSHPNLSRAHAAFTLTELLVVLLLIGILTGVMVVEMRGSFQDALLRSAAREVMNGIGLASSRAATLNEAHAFTFLRGSNVFSVAPVRSVPQSVGGDQRPLSDIRAIDERVSLEIRDPTEIIEEDEQPNDGPKRERDVITFYADGTADRREIILRDSYNVELVLRINPITGRVRIAEE